MLDQISSALHEKLNAPLYIDVTCYDCKRCVAMSNTDELDGRRYCHRCFNKRSGEQEPWPSRPHRVVKVQNGYRTKTRLLCAKVVPRGLDAQPLVRMDIRARFLVRVRVKVRCATDSRCLE